MSNIKLGYNPKIIEKGEEILLEVKNGKPRAFLGSIDEMTVKNESFRKVIYTGKHTQLVLMNLLPGEKIDREIHPNVDQFFRLEQGSIDVLVENPNENLHAENGDAVIIPSGTYHTVTAGPNGAKLYTLYSPANHPYDRVQDEKPEEDD